MSTPGQEFVEVFLQEASEHLQFLREYSGILQDSYPVPDDVQRLYISAHTLEGSSGSYGFPLFREVSSKLAHIFQYAMNAAIAPDATASIVEFISEAIAVLESDLLMISANSIENEEEIAAFKQRYSFAFEQPQPAAPVEEYVAPIHLKATPELPLAEEAKAQQDPVESPATSVAVPESKAAPMPEIPDLEPDGEIPAEILEFFVPEAEEHLQVVQDCLLALEQSPDPENIHRLFRAMHTVKGSAAQVGLHRISRVAHSAEDLVGRLRDGELKASQQIIDVCLESVDVLKKLLYNQWPDEPTLQKTAKSLILRLSSMSSSQAEKHVAEVTAPPASEEPTTEAAVREHEPPTAAPPPPIRSAVSVPIPEPSHPAATTAADAEAEHEPEFITGLRSKEPVAVPQSKSVRIALERLDSMMNAVGELVINRTRMLGRLAELERLAEVLNFSKGRMAGKIEEFQDKYEFSRITGTFSHSFGVSAGQAVGAELGVADPEFSELEMDRYDDYSILSRSLTEISADVSEVLTQLDGFVRRVDSDIDEFTKLAHRLQDEITQARMVPIGNLYTRISRTVRDAAKASGKQVELSLAGAETELDNSIIQQISDPLIHLVRNAVAHGLESNEERYNAGKTDHGNVAVRAYHRGNHIYIEVEDDGKGIDYDRVRKTAIENRLYSEDDAARLGERDLLELLFHPGFSTASRKTELAGRGVGLDVVRANLTALNGEIDVDTQQGLGTRFTLKVPLTLIISQALFVRSAGVSFAIPLAFIEEIRRVPANVIEEVGGKLLTRIRDVVTEIVRLDAQIGLPEVPPTNGFHHLVLVNVAGRQVGIVVEEVIRKDEIVIKNLGEYLRNVKLFPGATIAPDGSLILLIDVNRLVAGESTEHRPLMSFNSAAARIFAPGSGAVAAGDIPHGVIEPVPQEKVVILADDSISVRKFVGRMLEKSGYRVRLAADGLEALELALQGHCDLVITDLEMPRTNGYELMMHLRQSLETKNIPVIVVTSRAGAKHRERAIKEGAAGFLTKPVQDEQLIATVSELIGVAGGPVAQPVH